MLNTYYRVLDKGFIALKDVMGSDESIEQVTRTSYSKGTRKVSDRRNLLRYIIRHAHHSPLEFGEMIFHIRLPIYVFRQMVRHRTASVCEVSLRYSIAPDAFEEASSWRLQSQDNKQGSDGTLSEEKQEIMGAGEKELIGRAKEIYQERLDGGVAREQARKDLPISLYTTVFWKMDLRNLLHFLSLRMDKHAQQEIREYAIIIGKMVKDHFPLIWEAFSDYNLNSVRLSFQELEMLRGVGGNLGPRELKEYQEKISRTAQDPFANLRLVELSKSQVLEELGESIE